MFSKPEQTPEEDTFVTKINSIEDLSWYMKNSPIVFHHMLSIAARSKYENEEVIKRDIERNRTKKNEET